MVEFLLALLVAVLPVCGDESGTWCVWDASVQGNGVGQSFVAVGDEVFYLKAVRNG